MPTGTCCGFRTSKRRWPKSGDLTLLSDILPTGYHGCIEAGVRTGSTVYIAGAGPVGDAPSAYKTFSDGSPKKFVTDPHGSVKKAA